MKGFRVTDVCTFFDPALPLGVTPGAPAISSPMLLVCLVEGPRRLDSVPPAMVRMLRAWHILWQRTKEGPESQRIELVIDSSLTAPWHVVWSEWTARWGGTGTRMEGQRDLSLLRRGSSKRHPLIGANDR